MISVTFDVLIRNEMRQTFTMRKTLETSPTTHLTTKASSSDADLCTLTGSLAQDETETLGKCTERVASDLNRGLRILQPPSLGSLEVDSAT